MDYAGLAEAANPLSAMSSLTDSHFKGASLIVVGSVVRVKRGFSAAMGCYARLSSDLRAGADAKVAACGQAGGREHELAPW